jgi:predicted transcriptional regulator
VARLTRKSKPFHAPVYDVTVDGTHSFYAASGPRPANGVLAHNCHQMSKNALDALLKPMEDTAPGTDDKLLVCIFCTTEPGKMRSTIFSRCAPAFTIRAVTPEGIAERLATVCEAEGISYEKEALVTVSALTECHIRDALKTVEGVAMLGGVTKATVSQYLRLDANETVFDLLLAIGNRDTAAAVSLAEGLSNSISPSAAYERLSEACMVIYRHRLGVAAPPPYWSKDRVQHVSQVLGNAVLHLASLFADPPRRPATTTLALDVAQSCAILSGAANFLPHQIPAPAIPATPQVVAQPLPPPPPAEPAPVDFRGSGMVSKGSLNTNSNSSSVSSPSPPPPPSAPHETPNGVYIDPRAVRRSSSMEGAAPVRPTTISPNVFREALATRLAELRDDARRAGRPNLGGGGTLTGG